MDDRVKQIESIQLIMKVTDIQSLPTCNSVKTSYRDLLVEYAKMRRVHDEMSRTVDDAKYRAEQLMAENEHLHDQLSFVFTVVYFSPAVTLVPNHGDG